MAFLMSVAIGLNFISILLLFGLLYVYYKNLKNIKSKFTVGLFIFASLFLLQNIVALYYHLTMMEYYAPNLEKYECFFTLLQTIGFAVLLKITWD